MMMIIFGSGRVGRALLRTLEGKKHRITVVDQDRETCDETAAETNANVVCGDATDPELLEEIKIGEADYVFAVTGSQETNFLVSAYAKNVNHHLKNEPQSAQKAQRKPKIIFAIFVHYAVNEF